MLRMTFFGTFSVALMGKEPLYLAVAARPASLLAFLAIGRGRFFSRGHILQSLWGDHMGPGSMGSLNTALWRLRKVIEVPPARNGDYVTANAQGALGLNGPGEVWSDVEEFRRLTRPGLNKPLHQIGAGDIADMQGAVDLYAGDFLVDFSDTWALAERERHRIQYMNTLGRLIETAAIRGEYPAAIDHAHRVLEKDPLREDMHRDLMRYYVCNGQRALALRQFELCRDSLRRELAIQPMQETMDLYRRIAESATGHREQLERSLLASLDQASPPQPSLLPGISDSDPAKRHVQEARRLLAEADRNLRHSLTTIRG